MFRRLAFLAVITVGPAFAQVDQGAKNVPEFTPAFKNQTRAPEIRRREAFSVTRVARGLEHPWGIAVLPAGGYLVTERTGRLNHVSDSGEVTPVSGTPRVVARGQGGLLDVAIADDFETSRRVFLTYSKPMGDSQATAAGVGTLSADNQSLTGFQDIFVQTPPVSSVGHFGSRIVVDGQVAYITIGDRNYDDMPQNLGTTVGKVVRVATDGRIPSNNPFVGQGSSRPEIWSYGHRNPQGAALHPRTGELWTLEHGPAGGDELNLIRPGRNYGWPIVSYGEDYGGSPIGEGRTSGKDFTEPRYYWDPVIAPGDFTFYDGTLFEGWQGDVIAASLNPGGIVRLTLNGDSVTGEARYLGDLGRVRDVAVDRDGSLLVLTDDPNGGVFRVAPR
jgi:glucose/arabinose dehydrogenase